MRRHWVVLFAVLMMPTFTLATPADFHPPTTVVEHALDNILKKADLDEHQIDNLLAGRTDPTFRKTFDYRKVLTDPLIAAIRTKEKALVRNDCDGRYIEGYVCGLDYSPVTCAQDSNDAYLYRTEAANGVEVRITYLWPGTQKPVATYRLIRQAGQWKIDGVRCANGDAFNL